MTNIAIEIKRSYIILGDNSIMNLASSKSRFFTGITILLALLLAACSSPAATPTPTAVPQQSVTASGSGGATTVVKYLAKAYSQSHKDLAFNFLSGAGTAGGVQGVLDGQLDLGTMSRTPKESELANGIKFVALGNERVAIVTSSDLSIPKLTGEQVNDIFRGKIKNWSEVGGPNAPISALARDEEETLTQILRAGIFGKEPFPANVVVLTSAGDMQTALQKSTNTIGYLSYSTVGIDKLPFHVVAIDGHNPANIQDSYPYTRTLGVAYLPSNAAKVQPFIDFINSSEARALLTGLSITPVQ
jgi:phosphate transport system substrate-binding protein